MPRLTRRARLGLGVLLIAVALGLFITSTQVCLTTWVWHGVSVPVCPDGKLRPAFEVSAANVQRGAKVGVEVSGDAFYVPSGTTYRQSVGVRRFSADLALVTPRGEVQALEPLDGWASTSTTRRAEVQLSGELPDGDYKLRASIDSSMGDQVVEVPLPLYAPASIHVLTDRPLYEAGNEVKFRAVVLRASDLAPLDGRPGTWTVSDPSGETLLEERVPAGEWGVVAGTFPLDRGAASGDWKVRWRSGDAIGETSFEVKPFTLPRFRIEAAAEKPFYRAGDRPLVKGKVVYSSGAPVRDANVEVQWWFGGKWPVPAEWEKDGLPRSVKTDPAGRFTLQVPQVPMDLREQATLGLQLAATDPAGDRVGGSARVLLSEDAIAVSAVTELGDGLAQSFNNRMYLRATTADGRPLAGTELVLQRTWDPRDPGVKATTDADGVASLQVDPGVPVNVVIRPMPVRRVRHETEATLEELNELLTNDEPRFADRVIAEKTVASLGRCSMLTLESERVRVALRISPSGGVVATAGARTPLHDCVLQGFRSRVFSSGADRMFTVAVHVPAADHPSLTVVTHPAASDGAGTGEEYEGEEEEYPDDEYDAVGPPRSGPTTPAAQVDATIERALLLARACLPAQVNGGTLKRAIAWQVREGEQEATLSWVAHPGDAALSGDALACVQARVPYRVTLRRAAEVDALGLARLTLNAADGDAEANPQPTVMLGYEFKVSALRDGAAVGTTKLLLRPGTVPALRLRASPVLASAGEPLDLELLRGPDFTGEIPDELRLNVGGQWKTVEVEKGKRKAQVPIPADARGWIQAEWASASTLVYVKPKAGLTIEVTPDKTTYAPGELARLELATKAGETGGPAAVGLFGVDDSLGQVAALPDPDSLAAVRPKVAMSGKAFDVLDAQALVLGRIRGEHAAAATVLKASSVPQLDVKEPPFLAERRTPFDDNGELTEAFYNVLGELHAQARRWEQTAPPDELASPATVAGLWKSALQACEQRGERVRDAYDRPLRLSQLPSDLLALTDPRSVIVTATRLPEDVENWNQWVAEEMP